MRTTAQFYIPAIHVAFRLGNDGTVQGLFMGMLPGMMDLVSERAEAH